MGLKVSDKGSVDPIEAGVHNAVAYQVIDLGTQENTMFNKMQHKVMIIWEIPSLRIEVERDGKMVDLPRVISNEYTASISAKSNLGKHLNAWRGQKFTEAELAEFDLASIIGANCQLGVIHNVSKTNGNTYANIESILPLAKGTKKVKPENDTVVFDIDVDKDIPEGVPEWVADKIHASQEWKDREVDKEAVATTQPEEGVETEEEDIELPF